MGYINADKMIPRPLVREIQKYIDGAYLYIPRKSGEKRPWGHTTGIRTALQARNLEILKRRRAGATVAELSAEYFLSEKTISRIIARASRA